MRTAALILDMDGLMLDSEPLYKRAWQGAAKELGYELSDAVYLTMVGRSTVDCERQLLEHFGGRFPLPEFHSRWSELWRLQANTGIATKPGLMELLSFAEQHNLPVAVATSSDRDVWCSKIRMPACSRRVERE